MSSQLAPVKPSEPCRNDTKCQVTHAWNLSHEELLTPDDPVEGLFTRDQWEEIGSALNLSERELEVTILLAQGVGRRAIGLSLRKADGSSVSAETVRVYIDRIYRKAHVVDLQGLIIRLARVYLLLHGIGGTSR